MKSIRSGLLMLMGIGTMTDCDAQRHLAGLRGIEGQAGVVNNLSVSGVDNGGYYIGLGYSKYFSSKSYWKASLDFDQKRYLVRSSKVFTQRSLLGLAYYRTLMKDRGGNFYVNLNFGGMVGYEDINGGQSQLEPGLELKAKSKMMYGLSGGMEGELYLQDRLVLLVGFRQRWLIPSDAATFRWYLGCGLKWIIKK